jgi:hypothetical protein
MSKKVVVLTLVKCDVCNREATEDNPITEDFALTVGKAVRELEVCDECRDQLDVATKPFLDAARKVIPNKAPLVVPKVIKDPYVAPRPEGKRPYCPECKVEGVTFRSSPAGIGAHRFAKHGVNGTSAKKNGNDEAPVENWPEAQEEQVCPECLAVGITHVAKNAAGLGKHRNAAHGVKGTGHGTAA